METSARVRGLSVSRPRLGANSSSPNRSPNLDAPTRAAQTFNTLVCDESYSLSYTNQRHPFLIMIQQTLEFPPQHFTRNVIISGDKQRNIDVPDDEARKYHKALLRRLYGLRLPFEHATGGIPGKSLVDNIRPHSDSRSFYTLDMRNAFPSVDGDRLAFQLTDLGIFEDLDVARSQLYEYCLDPQTKGLPLGAPSSPYLFNIYCSPLDDLVAEYCESRGLVYTRYFDDITVSAPVGVSLGKHRRRDLRDLVLTDGWDIAHHKSKVHSLDNGPVTITGISLYPSGYWKLSPDLVDKVVQTFDLIEQKLTEGQDITEHDIGLLHGYHGVLTSTYDERRGQPTPLERRLIARYYELRFSLPCREFSLA